MACDDMVLAQTANPRAYAACLVSLAEKNLLRRGVALAQAAVGRMRQTSQRILRILDARASHAAQVWKPAPWVVGAFSIACLVSSAHAPKLVAFGDAVPRLVAESNKSGVLPVMRAQFSPTPSAPVIQATYKERRAEAVRPRAKSPVRTAVRRVPTAPVLVRASAPVSPETAPQQAVFVVMQGQRYGDAGPVLWRVGIWRVTVDPQGGSQVVQEIFARSI